MQLALAVVLALSVLAAAAWLWVRSPQTRDVPNTRGAWVAIAAGVLAWGCQLLERGLWDWTGLSLTALPGRESEALLSMFLFAAPLEEGAKVLSIWPLYSARRLLELRHGLVLASAAGAGFAAGELCSLVALGPGDGVTVLRSLVAIPAHVVAAALWGSTLGARGRTSFFALAWLLAVVLRGLFDHIVFGRGPGLMVLSFPLLLTMLAIAYTLARRGLTKERALALRASFDPNRRRAGWSEPASIRGAWQALEPKQQPLMLHWIGLGTLVTAGVGLVALGLGIYVGHALGLDFAVADEADVRSNGPLLFLATAVGAAFPIAGYLVARASGARSVLEPALGAALTVLGAVLFLSVTTPIAAIFALALTPIAFVLASAGAWFGTDR